MMEPEERADHLFVMEGYRLLLGVVEPTDGAGLERTPDPEPRRRAKGWRETIGEPREAKPTKRKRRRRRRREPDRPYVPTAGLWQSDCSTR